MDGAVNQKGSRVGLVLISPEKLIIKKSLKLGFSATNNEAEYEALLKDCPWFREWGESRLQCSQIQG